jgi:hypothetical protein
MNSEIAAVIHEILGTPHWAKLKFDTNVWMDSWFITTTSARFARQE